MLRRFFVWPRRLRGNALYVLTLPLASGFTPGHLRPSWHHTSPFLSPEDRVE